MATTVKTGWLHNKNGDKFAPKTLTSQVQTSDGVLLEDKIQADLDATKTEILASVTIPVDSELSSTSTNPVQNKVIQEALDQKASLDNAILKSGGTLTGSLILSSDPVQNLEAATKQYVDNINADSKNVWYGTCTTAAGTAAKVVTTTTGNFALETGATVYVLFNTAHTSSTRITLNVDGTGDTAVNTTSTNGITAYQISPKQVVCFVYDGESFRVQGGAVATTTYYGMTKLSSATNSTSTATAATSSAVKSAYDLASVAVPSSGGTMTGALVAQTNTDYTTAQMRNVILVADGETLPSGSNGDICLVYTP